MHHLNIEDGEGCLTTSDNLPSSVACELSLGESIINLYYMIITLITFSII